MTIGTSRPTGSARPKPSDRVAARVESLSTRAVWLVYLAGLAVFGGTDYATGTDLSFSIFYLLPVALVAWKSGAASALIASGLAAGVWLLADLVESDPTVHAAIPFWNAGVRFGFFAIVSLLLIRLRSMLAVEREHATVDPLTGIANSRAFRTALDAEVLRAGRYGRPITVGYVDLDEFKSVNDRFGHDAGDELLRRVAGAMRSQLRATDLLGRLGGDEFALMLPETGPENAQAACGKILAALTALTSPAGRPVRASIGAVASSGAPPPTDELLRAADAAMYRAKAGGGGRVVVERFDAASPAPVPGPAEMPEDE